MQAVKGYLSNGWFTPNDGVGLPRHARVVLLIEEVIDKPRSADMLPLKQDEADKKARIDWLNRVEAMLELSRDEDLSNFPKQELTKNLEDYPWYD